MPEGNKIGSAYVELRADVDKLEQALAEAKAKVADATASIDRSADTIGQSMEEAGDRAGAGMREASAGTEELERDVERLTREVAQLRTELEKTGAQGAATGQKLGGALGGPKGLGGGLSEAGGALTKLQAGFSKLLIPVAIVGAVAGLKEKLLQARREADGLRESFDRIADTAAKSARDADLGGRIASNIRDQQRVLEEAQARAAEIQRNTDQYLDRNDTALRSLTLRLVGRSLESTVREADEAIARTFEASRKEIEAIRRDHTAALVASVEAEVETYKTSRLSAIEQIDKAEREKIEEIRQAQRDATTQAARDQLGESIAVFQELYAYQRQEIDNNHQRELQNSRERAAKETENIEERAKRIERSLMDAASARRAELADDLQGIKSQIDAVRAGGIDQSQGEDKMLAALERLLQATERQAAAFEKSQNEQKAREDRSEERTTRAVERGVRNAIDGTGLRTTPQTLAAIYRNAELLLHEYRRGG